MQIREIPTEATIELRNRVLRPNQPREACFYPNDHVAKHFGAFQGERLMSVITAHQEDSPLFQPKGQWRIRGMASEPEAQGKGYGSAVLKALLEWGGEHGIPLIWCNAREKAIPFYLRHGFSVESDLFVIEGIGPHKVMKLVL